MCKSNIYMYEEYVQNIKLTKRAEKINLLPVEEGKDCLVV